MTSVLAGPVTSVGEHATIDFETASAAGYVWDNHAGKWKGPPGAAMGKKGLPVVGSAVYAEHPSTRVLTLSYALPGDSQRSRWRPGQPLPTRLFDWIARGGLVEAHKVIFERSIWERVCRRRYGFPPLPPEQLSCSMATARVNSYPPSLGDLGAVLELAVRKNADGRRLLKKFSMPRNPTKNDPRVWIYPDDDPADAEELYRYCDDDVATEELASAAMPPMTPAERQFWLVDQEINWRGLGVDRKAVRDCLAILKQCLGKYGEELRALTGGIEPTQIAQLKAWLVQYGVYADSLDAEHLEALLKNADIMICKGPDGCAVRGMPWQARRALEIRALSGSASVKKLYSMENMCSGDNRLRDLIVHHGARTGRPTGEGAQPLNMARSGPKLATCNGCLKPFKTSHDACPWCGCATRVSPVPTWRASMVDHVLEIMAVRSLELVEFFFGDALLAIAGCSRGLFVADEGNELVASDYSAIEAVVTGELANEGWRKAAFREGKSIYLESASKITGRSVAEYEAYYAEHGDHHPDRQNIGKVAELALGFGGWVNAWLAFDDSGTFTEYEIKELILAWRAASPAIVEIWGGQWRGTPWQGTPERFGFEGAAIDALQYPSLRVLPRVRDWSSGSMGNWSEGPDVTFTYVAERDVLLITLPSGRNLTYHEPRVMPSQREYAAPGELSLSYMTNNKNPKYGKMGWVRMSTFGGRLMENIVQAVAHDLLRFAILGLRAAGFPTVLHVYDEIVVEVAERPSVITGMLDAIVVQVETIMSRVPPWAHGWPVKASGGWRGRRYRKG